MKCLYGTGCGKEGHISVEAMHATFVELYRYMQH